MFLLYIDLLTLILKDFLRLFLIADEFDFVKLL